MSTAAPVPNGPVNPQHLAATGLSLSALGFLGWLLVLGMIAAVPKEDYTGDGQRDLLVGAGNLFGYLLQVLIGLVGLSINGTLSVTGTVISLIEYLKQPSNKSISGLALGCSGLAIGVGLIIYRMSVWGLFSA